MNKKDKADQEEKNEWFANHSADPKKIDEMSYEQKRDTTNT